MIYDTAMFEKKLEKSIKVIQLDRRPDIPETSHRKRSRNDAPKRFSKHRNPRKDYKNDQPKDGIENIEINPSLKNETVKKNVKKIEPHTNPTNDSGKSSLKNKVSKGPSKIDLNEKKLDEDFDNFIKQLDEIDTKPPSKNFKKKSKKKIRLSKSTRDRKKLPSSDSVTPKKRRASKRKPMPSQPTKKPRRQ